MTTKEKFIEEMEIDDAPVSICRLCAQISSSKSFIPLYTEDQQEETITKQINQLVIDLISPDDGLPQEVCIQCSENVELCFTFITKIIETQNKLKRLIQSPKSKDVANEDEYADSNKYRQRGILHNAEPAETLSKLSNMKCNEPNAEVMYEDTVDELVELLVVHPDGEVNIEDINSVLEARHDGIANLDKSKSTNEAEEDVVRQEDEQEQEQEEDEEEVEEEEEEEEEEDEEEEEKGRSIVYLKEEDEITAAAAAAEEEEDVDDEEEEKEEEEEEEEENDDRLQSRQGPRQRRQRRRFQRRKYMENEEDDEEEEEEEGLAFENTEINFAIKEEPDDLVGYSSHYDSEIIELPEHRVKWLCDGRSKSTEDYVTQFKCNLCYMIFDSEISFHSHLCVREQQQHQQQQQQQLRQRQQQQQLYCEKLSKNSFRCELCDKVFKSRLVFQLHYTQHKNSTLCQICNSCFLDYDGLLTHVNEKHPYVNTEEEHNIGNEDITVGASANTAAIPAAGVTTTAAAAAVTSASHDSAKQCDVCGKITENLNQHKIYHAIKELEYCKAENKKFLKKWFYCQRCNKKIFSEANFLFHVAKHNGEETVPCKQCSYVAINIQDYNMHITSHTGGKYFICNDCEKCFFTRSAISDHVLIHMEGTRYMCEICGKRFKTSRSNAQHKLLQHKKYFRCNRCNRGFTHETKLKSHYSICQVINQGRNESKVFEPVEKFFCNICNSNIKSSSEVSILFHKAKHEGKDGVECRFCNLLCKNACMYKNHLLIHTNQRPYACTQCSKSFRTKGCLVQHMLVHGNEYKYTCEYCGKKSKKLTTHVNHVNIHTDTKPYKCPDCDRPFRQLSDMKKHRRTHLKSKTDTITITELPYMAIKTEVEDMIAAESIQQIQLA